VPTISCAFLEVPNGMFCIVGRNSQDVVQFLKFFIGFLEVPYMHKIPRGSSENAKNTMIDFK
jgi:hypothetical protein